MTANVGLSNVAPSDIVHGEAHAHSSVEVHDSCNCFKFCFPCFGKKVVKKDPRAVRNSRTAEIARDAISGDQQASPTHRAKIVPHPDYNQTTTVDLTERSSDRPVRSHGMEDKHAAHAGHDLSVHVKVSTMDLHGAKRASGDSSEIEE